MSGEFAAALWGATVTAIFGLAAFGLERFISRRQRHVELQRTEFERISSAATQYTVDVIAGKDIYPLYSGMVVEHGSRLRLNLPDGDHPATWIEMVLHRMVLLGRVKPRNAREENARAENLEATLGLLTETLANLHHGTFDRESTVESFIGLINEAGDRDRRLSLDETPWWAATPPQWVTPPAPISKGKMFRKRLVRRARRALGRRAGGRNWAMEIACLTEEVNRSRDAIERLTLEFEAALLDGLVDAEQRGQVDEFIARVAEISPEGREFLDPLAGDRDSKTA